jgi:hypothetical protein
LIDCAERLCFQFDNIGGSLSHLIYSFFHSTLISWAGIRIQKEQGQQKQQEWERRRT